MLNEGLILFRLRTKITLIRETTACIFINRDVLRHRSRCGCVYLYRWWAYVIINNANCAQNIFPTTILFHKVFPAYLHSKLLFFTMVGNFSPEIKPLAYIRTLQSIFPARDERAHAIIFAESSISRDICIRNKIYCGIKRRRPPNFIPREYLSKKFTRVNFSPRGQHGERKGETTSTKQKNVDDADAICDFYDARSHVRATTFVKYYTVHRGW